MKHAIAWNKLDDYLDNELDSSVAIELEAHLLSCADCRQELEYLRGLTRMASRLRSEKQPARDLWPGIEAAITGRRTAAGLSPFDDTQQCDQARGDNWWRGFFQKKYFVAAASAASVLLVFVLSGDLTPVDSGVYPNRTPMSAETSNWGARGGIVSPAEMSEAQAIVAEFALTNDRLASICREPKSGNCEFIQTYFGEELELIEKAITESQAALDRNPYSQQAMSSLIAALKHREAVQLKALMVIDSDIGTT